MIDPTPAPDESPAPSADALLGVAVGELDDPGVSDHLQDLYGLRDRLDARIAEAAGVFDKRAVWASDGARNGPGWVTARTAAPYGRAKGDQKIGRALRDMPVTAKAFLEGRLSREQVDALIKARRGLEEPFDLVEQILVDEVARSTFAKGCRFLRRWARETRDRLGIDDDDGTPPDDGPGKLHLSSTFDGVWRLDGTLTAEQGEVIANAIDAQIDSMFNSGQFHHDDGMCDSERRAIALVEVVTRGTRGGDDDGCARPLVLGIVDLRMPPASTGDDDPVDLDGLMRQPADAFSRLPAHEQGTRLPDLIDGLGELARAGVVSRADVERWLCEGTLQVVIVGPEGDKLRMGRTIRTANREQRRALRVRDGECQFPGCEAPAEHCQAHHIVWWEQGGSTDLPNLILLCRFHHKAVHQRGFTIERDVDGIATFSRPDGTAITGTRNLRCNHRRPRPPPAPPPDSVDRPDSTEVAETRCIRRRIDALICEAHTRRTERARAGPTPCPAPS